MLFPVSDSRPSLSSAGEPLDWWDGGPAYVLASAPAVRVSFRGVFTLHRPLRDLTALGWTSAACNVSAWALCSAEMGQVFPESGTRMPENASLLPPGWSALGCAQSGTKVLVPAGTYDVSACDVLDQGLDVIYSQGRVYLNSAGMPLWEYWTLVVLAVVLVRGLSYNVQALWSRDPAHRKQYLSLAGGLALLGCVVSNGDALYATGEEQLLFWTTVAYLGVYLGIHCLHWWERLCKEHDTGYEQPVYNANIAALQLAAMRFYTGAQTPYTPVLLGMLASRTWTKLILQTRGDGLPWFHQVTLLLDALYIATCSEIALGSSRATLTGIFTAAFVGGELLTPEHP